MILKKDNNYYFSDYETKGGEKYKETVPALSVELYAVSKPEGESIRKELSKQIKDTFLYEEKVKQSQFKALSDDVKKKMYSTAKKNHVWIKIGEFLCYNCKTCLKLTPLGPPFLSLLTGVWITQANTIEIAQVLKCLNCNKISTHKSFFVVAYIII